jgi:hypothetical protein
MPRRTPPGQCQARLFCQIELEPPHQRRVGLKQSTPSLEAVLVRERLLHEPVEKGDELSIIIAPVVLGGGKRLFEGFSTSLEFEHLSVRQSQYATFIDYRVKRS